jgi:hypothetical protein
VWAEPQALQIFYWIWRSQSRGYKEYDVLVVTPCSLVRVHPRFCSLPASYSAYSSTLKVLAIRWYRNVSGLLPNDTAQQTRRWYVLVQDFIRWNRKLIWWHCVITTLNFAESAEACIRNFPYHWRVSSSGIWRRVVCWVKPTFRRNISPPSSGLKK